MVQAMPACSTALAARLAWVRADNIRKDMTRLPVLVRHLEGGGVVVLSVDFPEVGTHGASLGAALGRIQKMLLPRLARSSPSLQASLAQAREVTVRRIGVPIVVKRSDGETLMIQVGLVSWTHLTAAGQVILGRVPSVAGVEVVAQRDADVGARVRKALLKALRDWNLTALLAIDESEINDHGRSQLAPVTVNRVGDPADDDNTAEIVRQYHEGRRQYVKDPRTGTRITNVRRPR
jgi:hypothetical protein